MNEAHTMDDLKYYQALPLSLKIPMSRNRIRKWIDKYGVDGSCVAMTFSPESWSYFIWFTDIIRV